MSRTKRFLSAMSLGYVSQALIILTGLWLTPFLLYHIGQQEYGLWLVGLQFTFYLSLLDIGVVALVPRTVAYATGRAGSIEAAADLPEIIGHTGWLVLWQLPAAALLGAILFWTIPAEWESLRGPLGLIILGYVLLFPFRILPAILQGLQDMTFTITVTLIAWVANTALTITLLLAGWHLYALAVGWLAQQTLAPLLCWMRLRLKFRRVLPTSLPHLSWQIMRANLSQGGWVSVAQIAQLLVNSTDVVIIGKLLGTKAVVPYACTNKLITVLANQPQLLMQQALPALSELRTSESRERLRQVMSALSLAMIMVSGLVVCVVLVVNQGFVNWWVGNGQFAGGVLSSLFLTAMLLRHWNTTWIYSLFCFGYERRLFVTNLVESVFAIICTYLLVKKYGLVGGPIGAIIGICLVSLPINLLTFAREMRLPILDLLRNLLPWAWRFILLLAFGSLITAQVEGKSFYLTAAAGLGVALAYAGLMLPVIFNQPLAVYALPFTRRLLRGFPGHSIRERVIARLNWS